MPTRSVLRVCEGRGLRGHGGRRTGLGGRTRTDSDGAIVLMRSGWPASWEQGDGYYNRGDDGRLHSPGFGEDAARYLVENHDIAGIRVDTGCVDPGNAVGFRHTAS